jgi:hypothetical protein
MAFQKGQSGNPRGAPIRKNTEANKLREALNKVELQAGKWKGVNFWDRVAKVAYEDTKVMVAIVKKFVPDKTHLSTDGPLIVNKMQTVIVNDKPLEYNIGNSRTTEDTGHPGEVDTVSN